MSEDQYPVNDQPVEPTTPPEQAAPPAEPPKVIDQTPATPGVPLSPPPAAPPAAPPEDVADDVGDDLGSRLERLGGEPAPDITPEEFARLQQAGQIHIDPRGRVRATRRDETDAGISLRKRRAWYAV
ncbi:MAG: hypothetical protein IT325_09540 [Anaerolineae bacterium]|nr:hypothetical protein [Anaerolineae bacterium]